MAKKNLSSSDIVFAPHPKRKDFQNLTGLQFGRLQVIGYSGRAGRKSRWHCRCACGKITNCAAGDLKTGHSTSCGCLTSELHKKARTKHGMLKSSEYESYAGAKKRCKNPNQKTYDFYGGRGIEFRFTSFEQFIAEVGMRPSPEYSIDRIDTNGHYEPGNVRWASNSQQVNNKRCNVRVTINGETKTLAQWCGPSASIFYKMVRKRILRGWCSHCAIITPSGVSRPLNCDHA